MDYRNIDYSVRDRIAEITMTRGPVNAVDHALIDEILDALESAQADGEVRCVILTSAYDKAFSAGMDLAMIRGGSGTDLRRFLEKLYVRLYDLQYRMGKPTIAALTGPARAAGVTLAVSCDVLIAGDTVTLGYPEIDVGLIPALHFVHLPRQIGRHQAFELLFSGKPIGAQDACARGLVNRVVPQDKVLEEARALAAAFAAKSPAVMKLARDAFMRVNDRDYRRAIENTIETMCNIIALDDAQEGLNAFNEKRPPRW